MAFVILVLKKKLSLRGSKAFIIDFGSSPRCVQMNKPISKILRGNARDNWQDGIVSLSHRCMPYRHGRLEVEIACLLLALLSDGTMTR
jgi:hypothetical protein